MTLGDNQRQSISTARVTGVWYLLLAISGMLGFLVLHCTHPFFPPKNKAT